jgi:hypothetical protein
MHTQSARPESLAALSNPNMRPGLAACGTRLMSGSLRLCRAIVNPGCARLCLKKIVGNAVGNDGKIYNYFNADNGRAEPVPFLIAATSA